MNPKDELSMALIIDEYNRFKSINAELLEVLRIILQRYYDRPIGSINDLETDSILKIEQAISRAEGINQ